MYPLISISISRRINKSICNLLITMWYIVLPPTYQNTAINSCWSWSQMVINHGKQSKNSTPTNYANYLFKIEISTVTICIFCNYNNIAICIFIGIIIVTFNQIMKIFISYKENLNWPTLSQSICGWQLSWVGGSLSINTFWRRYRYSPKTITDWKMAK